MGATCLLAGDLYTPVPVDGQYFGHEGVPLGNGVPDPVYGFTLSRLDDGIWTTVPDTLHELTDWQFQLARCIGGGMRFGRPDLPGPVWSPLSGWVDRESYLAPPSLEVAPEPVTSGQADQLFVLQTAGVIRRWFDGPDGPMSAETLDVPADIFVQPYGPVVQVFFDASPNVIAGCVQQSLAQPTARCYLRSV